MKMIKTSISLQELRRRIYFKSKEEKSHRFWGLYVHICKYETLEEAYLQTKRNNGSTGIDNISFADIESMGREKYLKEISKNSNVTVTPGTFTKTELFVPIKKEKLMIYVARRLEHDKNASMLIEACNTQQAPL
jgi:hypothetical protein